jgi:hypothetical protein
MLQMAMAGTVVIVAVMVAGVTMLGGEAKGNDLSGVG